jgi:beta-1,2-mannobiose phosphorylase / 1,2-beta-oligomannan phosphorylase
VLGECDRHILPGGFAMVRRLAGTLGILLALGVPPSRAQEFPPQLVKWVPLRERPVFQGGGDNAWDRKIRERGWILQIDGTYHLWYTGYNDALSPNKFLGHATSPDGLDWTRDPANPLVRDSWVEDMCVVRDGGRFFMFAEGKDDIAHLLTAEDPTHWTDRGPLDIRRTNGQPISPGPRGTPTVWVEDGKWYLFYERGDRGVWLATSEDPTRIEWKNAQDDPVLPMGPKAFDKYAVAVNQIIKRDGIYYAFYHANAHQPWKDWTTDIARSKDLVRWEKYPGNPIIDSNCSSGIVVPGPSGLRLYTMHPEVRVFVHSGSNAAK